MSETVGENRLNVDREVAYAAKDLRSIAAAKRLIDPIATEAKGIEKTDHKVLKDVTDRLMGAYAIYPEVFTRLYRTSKDQVELSHSVATSAISEILQRGELPTYKIVGAGERSDAESFDERANIDEEITEALVLNPPTQDFLRDSELGRDTYLGSKEKGNEYRVTLEDVRALVGSIKYSNERIRTVGGELVRSNEDSAEVNAQSMQNKLQRVVFSLEMVDQYMPLGSKEERKAFNDSVKEAKNSDETTIADLRVLYTKGLVIALELHTAIRDKKQAIYDAVISGKAATYKTPEVDGE